MYAYICVINKWILNNSYIQSASGLQDLWETAFFICRKTQKAAVTLFLHMIMTYDGREFSCLALPS